MPKNFKVCEFHIDEWSRFVCTCQAVFKTKQGLQAHLDEEVKHQANLKWWWMDQEWRKDSEQVPDNIPKVGQAMASTDQSPDAFPEPPSLSSPKKGKGKGKGKGKDIIEGKVVELEKK
eukprot:9586058-Karenia_brevis.AAC.1